MQLTVQKREKFGKANQSLRREGLIPAEVYGHGFSNQHLAVLKKDFRRVFSQAGESTVINLVLGAEGWPVLIYNVQRDYLSGEVVHVDFYRVKMDEKITTHVPLEFLGEAPAIKEKLGILNKSMDEVEVEALPGDLPHKIEVDLSGLVGVGSNVYVKDLKVSPKVRVVADLGAVVATVVSIKEEAVPATVDVSAVKVEGEEKKLEKDQEKEKDKTSE